MVVSHSRALARAAIALAGEMLHGDTVRVEEAAGLDGGAFGTDAVRVAEAIGRADTGGGVVVLMDLGSAVLSAEVALDLLDPGLRERVTLCPAPLVEGLCVAAVAAAGGAGRGEVAAEAQRALGAKEEHLGAGAPAAPAPGCDAEPPARVTPGDATGRFEVTWPHGLHARPAAVLVRAVRGLDADVRLRNLSRGGDAVPAGSLSRVAALGAEQGHLVDIMASGPDARRAVERLLDLARHGFGDLEAPPVAPPTAEAAGPVEPPLAAGPLPASPGVAIGPAWMPLAGSRGGTARRARRRPCRGGVSASGGARRRGEGRAPHPRPHRCRRGRGRGGRLRRARAAARGPRPARSRPGRDRRRAGRSRRLARRRQRGGRRARRPPRRLPAGTCRRRPRGGRSGGGAPARSRRPGGRARRRAAGVGGRGCRPDTGAGRHARPHPGGRRRARRREPDRAWRHPRPRARRSRGRRRREGCPRRTARDGRGRRRHPRRGGREPVARRRRRSRRGQPP